ncbi:MAG: hypothetical protein ACOX7C_05685 [Brevefilum sp.]|jgi:uncharacterized membrane protein
MKEKVRKDYTQFDKTKRLLTWNRMLAVLFRVLLLLGVIFLAFTIVAWIFASWFNKWAVILALGLIAAGVILARVEYQIHQRLHD